MNKKLIDNLSEIIKDCKYIVSELDNNGYFKNKKAVFCGINKITKDTISIYIYLGSYSVAEVISFSFPTKILFNNDAIEILIKNALNENR